MADDLISVVVPAYNSGPWLRRCLESLLTQLNVALEIVVADDGSTDDTPAIVQEYTRKYPNVKYLHQENRGVTAARLLGVSQAAGDWIGFMDADDWVEPGMYHRLLENAKAYGTEISHCGHRICFPDGRVSYVYNTGTLIRLDNLESQKLLLENRQMDSSLCTKLFRRELFAGIEGWMDSTIQNNEDLLMNYYLFRQARATVYEDRCPYHYILRANSASYHRFDEHALFDPVQVRQKILASCSPEIQDQARDALIRYLLFVCAQSVSHRGKESAAYRRRARQLLLQQKPWFSLLSRRNRILARMICTAPWAFCLSYGAYEKLFRREEEH